MGVRIPRRQSLLRTDHYPREVLAVGMTWPDTTEFERVKIAGFHDAEEALRPSASRTYFCQVELLLQE